MNVETLNEKINNLDIRISRIETVTVKNGTEREIHLTEAIKDIWEATYMNRKIIILCQLYEESKMFKFAIRSVGMLLLYNLGKTPLIDIVSKFKDFVK